MSNTTIVFDHVAKRFSKNYISDSLRDALFKPFESLFSRNNGNHPYDRVKEFWALKDINFQVKKGEVLGIIGRNGSGKSTTLKLISRLLRPNEGTIEVQGHVSAMIELSAGFSPDLTGKENIFLYGSILGMKKTEVEEKFDRIIEFAEIKEFIDTPVKWYSSGMLARLGFAVAANMQPDILLIDEVLSVGDIGFQKKCLNKMNAFRTQGITIVFVSHNIQAIASICNHVIVLNEGRLAFQGKTSEAISYYLKEMRESSNNESNVKLQRGEILDTASVQRSNYDSGENAQIHLCIKSLKDLPNFNIGIEIRKKDGTTVFASDYTALTGERLSMDKDRMLQLVMQIKFNLVPGLYDCVALVWDEILDQPLGSFLLSEIIMESNVKSEGVAFLEPDILDMSVS